MVLVAVHVDQVVVDRVLNNLTHSYNVMERKEHHEQSVSSH
jgi:hypothetical protein